MGFSGVLDWFLLKHYEFAQERCGNIANGMLPVYKWSKKVWNKKWKSWVPFYFYLYE